jgi:hypothetical protein
MSDLWRRWRCSKCGSKDEVPFSVGKARDPRCRPVMAVAVVAVDP